MSNVRIRAGFRVAAGIAALGLPLAMASNAFASPPGDNGTVKIHITDTPQPDRENQPQVCHFYLDAFGFDTVQSVHWEIDTQAPTMPKDTKAASGDITLTDGIGKTDEVKLAKDGHYKLFWNFNGENGEAKQKVFWVDCGGTTPPSSSSPGGSHSSSSPSSEPSTSTSVGASSTSPGGSTGGTGGTTGGTTPSPSATTPGNPPTTSPSTGNLAHTGADGSVLYIAAGAIALGGGGFALRKYAIARGKA